MRRILIEAAQHCRHCPLLRAALRKRQEGIWKQVLAISWVAQQRLCRRLTHFTKSDKARNKAIVSLARELAGFIWSLGQVSHLLA